jgi:hypothetical protein
MLTETELPNWAGGHRVVGVGGQTWRQVDDVGLLTDHDGWIGVQGKKNLKLSTELDSDLAGALAQLVALDAAGVPDRPPAQDLFRALDPLVDRVLILTCDEAPATITRDMARLTDRLRTWPAAVPLREAAVNGGERKAWDVLREHVVRLRSAHHGAQADETQLRALLRPLAVQGLDLRPQGRDTDRLVLRLRDMLEDSEEASKLWGRLELIGRDIAVTRSWLERDALLAELENRGFRITPVARLRRDVRRLRAVTAANLATPPSSLSIGTPEGPVSIQRAVTGLLRNHRGRLAITGDPGCGKSVLLHGLAADSDAEMVYLTHQQLRGTAGQTRTELNLQHDLVEVLAGWPGSRPALLLLDGLDQTRGTDASTWGFLGDVVLDQPRLGNYAGPEGGLMVLVIGFFSQWEGARHGQRAEPPELLGGLFEIEVLQGGQSGVPCALSVGSLVQCDGRRTEDLLLDHRVIGTLELGLDSLGA